MTAETIEHLINSLGLPIALVVIGLIGLAVLFRWGCQDDHKRKGVLVRFFESQIETQRQMGRSLAAMERSLEESNARESRFEEWRERQVATCEAHAAGLAKTNEYMAHHNDVADQMLDRLDVVARAHDSDGGGFHAIHAYIPPATEITDELVTAMAKQGIEVDKEKVQKALQTMREHAARHTKKR